jgi:hypothetical protein
VVKGLFSRWPTSRSPLEAKTATAGLTILEASDLDQRLKVTQQARTLAANNLPNAQAQSLSGIELQIIQTIEQFRQKRFDSTLKALEGVQQDISQINELPDLQNIWLIESEFQKNASLIVSEQSHLVRRLASAAKRQVKELERFKKRHQLQRDADYPSSSGQFLRYCLLVFLIVVEALFNAEFFSEGLSSGLLGGFTYAASLAAVNILISFFMGKGLVRWIFHRDKANKAFGVLALVMTLGFVFCMALGIAHIRDQLVLESMDPARLALESLQAHPFVLGDLFSWLLLAVSLSFALGAMTDGLLIDDVYPGYGKMARQTQVALNDYLDELDEIRQELEDDKIQSLLDLDNSIENAKQSILQYRGLIEKKKSIRMQFNQMLSDSSRTLEVLIQHFRTENEIHRSDGVRPAYFDLSPTMKPLELPWVEQDEQQLILHTRLMQTLASQSQDIRDKLNQTFQHHLEQLTFVPIEELDPLDTRFH